MALFLRTTTSLFLVLAFLSGAGVAAADTLAQAATATPTPRPSGPTPTAIPCVVPKVGVQIILENPQPYDTLISGTQVVMNGVAYDTGATSGSGVSQVSLYLGSRDAGGMALGNALLRRIVQSYLAAGQTAYQLIQDAGLGPRDEKRVRFGAGNLIEAVSPSNMPLVNPSSAKAALDTGGLSLARGGLSLLRDMASPPRIPEMVDRSAFEVGRNIAVTPGEVVLRTEAACRLRGPGHGKQARHARKADGPGHPGRPVPGHSRFLHRRGDRRPHHPMAELLPQHPAARRPKPVHPIHQRSHRSARQPARQPEGHVPDRQDQPGQPGGLAEDSGIRTGQLVA